MFSPCDPPVWMIKVCIFFFNVIWFDCLISFPPIFKSGLGTDSVTETPGDSAGSAQGRHLGRAQWWGEFSFKTVFCLTGQDP